MWSYIGFNIDKTSDPPVLFSSQMSRLAKLLSRSGDRSHQSRQGKIPELDLRYALGSSSYSMKADALYEITSRNKATFEEMRRISNLQTT